MVAKNWTLSFKIRVNLAGPCFGMLSTERELENLAMQQHISAIA